MKYVTVQAWPSMLSTLWGIAQSAGISLDQVEKLNPQYSANYNLIYAGQQVRIA
jgi:LysM repeat protein